MKYVEAIANMQTSKFKDTGDVDSDSDSEIEDVNGEAEEEPTQAAEEQAEPTPSQSDITCRVCMDREVNAIIQPCCHSICLTCGDIFKQQKKEEDSECPEVLLELDSLALILLLDKYPPD